jgi:hypothetical protein
MFNLLPSLPPSLLTDVNKNDFQEKFAGYGIYRFQSLPTNQNEN